VWAFPLVTRPDGVDHGPVEGKPGQPVHILPYGDRALLVEVAGLAEVEAVRGALERTPLPGQRELVPAARTVLVVLDREPSDLDVAALRRLPRSPRVQEPGRGTVELPVVFDGPDLGEVAALTGRTVSALVEALTQVELTVAFGGFAPGFAYLAGLPEELHVPRRATPRTRVPAGSVGLAGPYAGAYPQVSPGGWQLVGHTDAVLFDVQRRPPALLVPGARVRFQDVRSQDLRSPGVAGQEDG
jgi:KipI family sensor histidine kinase inhibitor